MRLSFPTELTSPGNWTPSSPRFCPEGQELGEGVKWVFVDRVRRRPWAEPPGTAKSQRENSRWTRYQVLRGLQSPPGAGIGAPWGRMCGSHECRCLTDNKPKSLGRLVISPKSLSYHVAGYKRTSRIRHRATVLGGFVGQVFMGQV